MASDDEDAGASTFGVTQPDAQDELDAVVTDALVAPDQVPPTSATNENAEPEPIERPNLPDASTERGVTPKPPVQPPAGSGPIDDTTKTLAWLLSASPFLDLHIQAFRKGASNPWRRNILLTFDVTVRLVVAALIIAVAAAVAWKTLSPLPPLFKDNN